VRQRTAKPIFVAGTEIIKQNKTTDIAVTD